MVQVPELADRRLAVQVDQPHFARGQPNMGIVALLGEQLGDGAGCTDHLCAFSGPQLDVVNQRAQGNDAQGQRVARLNICRFSGDNQISRLQLLGGQDVSFVSVHVMEQGDSGGPVRVVFNACDPSRNIQLVPFEINETIASLVTSSAVSTGNPASAVSSSVLGQTTDEGLLGPRGGEFPKGGVRLMSSTSRGRFELLQRHGGSPGARKQPLVLDAFKEFDLIIRSKGYDCLLPVSAFPDEATDTFVLAALVQGAYAQNPDLEDLLHCSLDLLFVRIRVDFKGDFVALFLLNIPFFRYDRTPDDRIEILHDP
jgi:hypothetical protein